MRGVTNIKGSNLIIVLSTTMGHIMRKCEEGACGVKNVKLCLCEGRDKLHEDM